MENDLAIGNLKIQVKDSPARLRLLWSGEADEQNPTQTIRPFLTQSTKTAVSQKQKIVINLSRLNFMNSSCIGLFTNFIRELDELGAEVEIVFNTSKTWQVMTMRCTSTIFSTKENIRIVDMSCPTVEPAPIEDSP